MLAIQKKIEDAVSKAMADIEPKLVAMSKEAIEKNRQIMMDRLDEMDKSFDACVEKQVLKVLKEKGVCE